MPIALWFAVLALVQQSSSFVGLDRELVKEITAWKKGSPPPPKLLQFPAGPPAPRFHCGLIVFGSAVGHYVSGINDDDLLQALLFDSRADAPCVRAAGRRLLELRGAKRVREMVADRRKAKPGDFTSTELATLAQLLTSPYARIYVATLKKKDVPREVAEKALTDLKTDLVANIRWDKAYEKAADALFDKARSEREGGGRRTFLCYMYDGLIAPTGFDLLDRSISNELRPEHVRKLFQAKAGVYRMDTDGSYWLYYVEALYEKDEPEW